MKLKGIFGKGTGKVGASVFAVSGGEQIVREYNPNVSNPNTDAQIAQRAKLKLLSQIAAALAIIIAFAKKGLVSARNQFISANYPLTSFEDNQAKILVEAIDLTGGIETLPAPSQVADDAFRLEVAANADIDAVLYAGVNRDENDKLVIIDSQLVTTPGANRTFPVTMAGLVANDFLFAYGVKFANKSDKVRYENYVAVAGDTNATLDVVKSMAMSGATFTQTKCLKLV